MRFAEPGSANREPRTSGHCCWHWYRGLCCAASITSANFYLFCGHGGLIVRALVSYSGRLDPAPLQLTFVSPPDIVAGIGTVGYAVPPRSPLHLIFVSFVEALLFGPWVLGCLGVTICAQLSIPYCFFLLQAFISPPLSSLHL